MVLRFAPSSGVLRVINTTPVFLTSQFPQNQQSRNSTKSYQIFYLDYFETFTTVSFRATHLSGSNGADCDCDWRVQIT